MHFSSQRSFSTLAKREMAKSISKLENVLQFDMEILFSFEYPQSWSLYRVVAPYCFPLFSANNTNKSAKHICQFVLEGIKIA